MFFIWKDRDIVAVRRWGKMVAAVANVAAEGWCILGKEIRRPGFVKGRS